MSCRVSHFKTLTQVNTGENQLLKYASSFFNLYEHLLYCISIVNISGKLYYKRKQNNKHFLVLYQWEIYILILYAWNIRVSKYHIVPLNIYLLLCILRMCKSMNWLFVLPLAVLYFMFYMDLKPLAAKLLSQLRQMRLGKLEAITC